METPKRDAIATARNLIGAGGTAALSVIDVDGGKPFVTFVNFAADHDLRPLILISDLAHHAKCLLADSRGSLLIHGPIAEGDPMLTFRATLQGEFRLLDEKDVVDAFLVRHPYAEVYAGFSDFHIWRMEPDHAHIIAGFGRAYGVRYQDVANA